jgi:Phosphate-selective porin O and P
LYWAPKEKRALFSSLVKDGYKGSGDYGIVAFGVYNGQTANKPELNDNLHVVARVTYPFEFKGQIFEPGIQAYTGQFTLPKEQTIGVKTNSNATYTDERIAASLVMYPKPFGFQVEYNIGQGPEYNKQTDSIEHKNLSGGYILLNYKLELNKTLIYPFTRYHYYDGGKKHERDARSYNVNEFEIGVEWQPNKTFEFVAMYTVSDRRFEDGSGVQTDGTYEDNRQQGSLLRLQAQVNF